MDKTTHKHKVTPKPATSGIHMVLEKQEERLHHNILDILYKLQKEYDVGCCYANARKTVMNEINEIFALQDEEFSLRHCKECDPDWKPNRDGELEAEHESNESMKGHTLVMTCTHVHDLGVKPSRHNIDGDLCCSECVLDMMSQEPSQKADVAKNLFTTCLDCSGKCQDMRDLK